MTRGAKIALNVITAVVLLSYLAYTIVDAVMRSGEIVVRDVRVEVLDSSEIAFVTSGEIRAMLLDSLSRRGMKVDSLNLWQIEESIRGIEAIESVEAVVTMEGLLSVEIWQRTPIVRLMDDGKYGRGDYYMDSSYNFIPPTRGYRPDVLVVSGELNLSFKRDSLGEGEAKKNESQLIFIKNIHTFVGLISGDKFFADFVDQIYIRREGNSHKPFVEIVPFQRNGVVYFGDFNNMEAKLQKIKTFYRDAYRYASLGEGDVVDVRFENQVVVRRR
ncbi:MAG: hypothetical protein R3Y61_02660 [Rikenellaceae bacterium]